MTNVKGYAVATDGGAKRIAITYDKIDESGKVINSNQKTNRVVVDEDVLDAISVLDTYTKKIAEET